MNTNQERTCDVLVCGGGIAGTIAAVAASRQGAKVILAERYGFLGGNATAGAVAQFNCWQTASGRRVIAGLAQEVVNRLTALGGAGEHKVFVMSNGHKMDRVEYSPELLKLVLDEMVLEAGVQPLLHASLLDVQCDSRRVKSVRFLIKGRVLSVRSSVMIDASGDLDAVRQAGARFLELDEGEALQPATMMFRFGPIQFESLDILRKSELAEIARKGYESGELARAALHFSRQPFSQDGWFNISRLTVDATDAMALGQAEIEGRKQAWKASRFLREHVPGCQDGQLQSFATQIGIRETRRVEGDHVLTAEELLLPLHFEDSIALGAYPIDIHPNSGGGLDYRSLDADHAYEIPYGSLIPTTLDNTLVIGRGISATHEALAAVRVMTISMAVGQAAGIAAAMACLPGQSGLVRSVHQTKLCEALLQAGALLA
jgi:2-polyprenyl-6-methoxyphenol hydroxylase-like FAD-dependent oxidoreductase